jgi:hypothetical protein
MEPGYSRSRFQEGFAALREEPLLLAAELSWRWCFALAAWLIALFAAAMFLDSLPASSLDRFLLGTLNPALESSALSHILHGALLRYIWIKFIVLAGLTLLWAFASAVGRAASLRNLIALAGGEDRDEDAGWQLRPMFQLHLLRALWTWTALGCFLASGLLGNLMWQQRHAARAGFFCVFGLSLSIVFGVMLNWIFGLAPLFCIRAQAKARDAVTITLEFCTRQGGRLFGMTLAFLALRIVWAGSMFFLVLAPTALGKHVALGWQFLVMGILFLIYLAGADALYLARLGAYAVLAEIDAQPDPEPTPAPQPWTPETLAPLNPPSVDWDPGTSTFSPSA